MDKQQAINSYRNNALFAKLHPLRQVSIPITTARALGLQVPEGVPCNRVVKYYVRDVRAVCGIDSEGVPATDETYGAARIEQLKNELIPEAETEADAQVYRDELAELERKQNATSGNKTG